MDQKEMEQVVARGIAQEKSRESLAVLKVLGAVILAWVVGAGTESVVIGVALMLVMLYSIWRTYTGKPIENIWFKRAMRGVAIAFVALFAIVIGLTWWAGSPDDAGTKNTVQPAPLTPAQVREKQIQSALNKAYIPVQVQIQSMMHDPDSFEMVNASYADKGEYLVLTVQFRGRNKFGAKVLDSVDARVGLDGSVWTVGKIE